jgi:ParB-like nuclease family protein
MGTACSSISMDWADKVDAQTLHDAWSTYNTNFAAREQKINKADFEQYVSKAGYYTTIPLSKLTDEAKFQVSNMNLTRLSAESIEEAYPYTDNPRGEQDIKSVEYFVNTTEQISPIIMIKTGKTNYVLLDGMHRLVASKLRSGLDHAEISALILPSNRGTFNYY